MAEAGGGGFGLVILDSTSVRAHAKAAAALKKEILVTAATTLKRLGDLVAAMVKGYGRRPARAERPGSWPASASRPSTNARGSCRAMGIGWVQRERDGAADLSGGQVTSVMP